MAKQTRRTGRPPSTPGQPKRSAFNTRLRAKIKKRLEFEAERAGRSLSEEIEIRLEQSFRDEDALIEAFGGRHTHSVLKVMGSLAAHIQTRTGKSASDDWKTGLAVGRAWKRLIFDWLAKPPAEWIAEVERLSDMPEAPERPVPLVVRAATEEEEKAYLKGPQNFEKDLETFMIAFDKREAAFLKIRDEVKKAAGIGEEALGLLSDQEK